MRWLNKVSVPTECSAETGKALEKVFFGSVASDWMSSGLSLIHISEPTRPY